MLKTLINILRIGVIFLFLGTTLSYADCLGSVPNGSLDPGEQCDDGNAVNNDVCTNSCQPFVALTCNLVYGTEINTIPSSVTEYDPIASISSTLPLKLSGQVSGSALSPDANIIAYYDRISTFLKSYNITTGVTTTGTVSVGAQTRMAFNQSGQLFSMNAGTTLSSINTTTMNPTALGALSNAPGNAVSISTISGGDIIFSGDDLAYLIDNGGRFFSFNSTTLVATYITTFPALNGTTPAGLTLGPDGRIFAFTSATPGIYEVDLVALTATLVNTPLTNNADAFSCAFPNLTDVLCGNGVAQGSEQCDDGNLSDTDACTNACTVPVCGDGLVDNDGADNIPGNADDEKCDGLVASDNNCLTIPGGFSGGTLSCSPSCQFNTTLCISPVCGDGNVDSGEACDDGNLVPGDGCDATCLLEATCGNSITEVGEQCDDGNAVNTDACTNACTLPICGDGIINGTDQCDDANLSNTDACSNACTLTIDLNLTKVVDNATPTVGDVITFTLTLSNTGTGPATGVVVRDILPSGYTLGVATPSQGTFLAPDWTVGTVATGQTVTLTITATVLPTGTYTNFAQIFTANETDVNSTPGNDVGSTPDENDEASSSPSIQIADPGITKTVDNPNPDLNGIINYFITVTNNGPSTATNVVVADILPPGLTLISATATSGTVVLPTWTLTSIASGNTETLTISARVDVANPITNSATLTSTTFDPNPSNNQGNVTVTARVGTISGHLFWDDNRNQVQDPGDQNLTSISLIITDSRGSFTVVTDSNGNYRATVAPGSVTVAVDPNDPDLPEDYVITVGQFNRTVNVLGAQSLVIHHLGIDDEEHNPGQEGKDDKKDKKKQSITVTLQRRLASTGIPLEAGTTMGFISLASIIGLNLRRSRRY